MPDVDDGLDGLARDTNPLAGADAAGEGVDLLEDLVHVGDRVLAVDRQGVGRGAAQRGVQNARSSVTLMCSPVNIALRRSARFTSSASLSKSCTVSSVMRFFERSTCRSAASKLKFLGAGRILLEPGSQIRSERCFVLG